MVSIRSPRRKDAAYRESGDRMAQRAASVIVFLILATPAIADRAPRIESFDGNQNHPMSNFDALNGVWKVESYNLRERMRDEEVWQKNLIETEHRSLLGGYVAVNDTYGTFNMRKIHGIMIRTFDPDKKEWTFDWMSRDYPHLTEQVRGRFENGVGLFYGEEVNKGRLFKMRFRWKQIAKHHFFWDQSYQDPETKEWQINWTTDLTRDAASVSEH